MVFRDNREFIEALKKSGDVVTIEDEIDWNLEAGAIVRRTCEREGPAVLFNKVKDYPDFRVFGAPLATYRRYAVAFGLPPETPVRDIIAQYSRRRESLIKPILVSDGPCQDNIIQGKDVDLLSLPAPMVHEGDGGRYIGTWHAVIARDPDTNWTNWGMYRLMIHNERHMGGIIHVTSDMGTIFYQKFVPKNKPMPFAVALGMDPLSSITAMTKLPFEVAEVDAAGGLLEEPIELVKCVTNDLLVPAFAEIILEGELLPDVTVMEGPFGEFTGFRASPRVPKSVYKVNAITYRDNPILTITNMGTPVHESNINSSISGSYEVLALLRSHKIPVTDVCVPKYSGSYLIIISVKTLYANMATQIANLIFRGNLPISLVVVNDDVDVYDLEQVVDAISKRCHPVRGIKVYPDQVASPLTPFLSLEEKIWSKGAKVLYDCTWPLDWPKETTMPVKASFENMYPKETKEKILKNWTRWNLV